MGDSAKFSHILLMTGFACGITALVLMHTNVRDSYTYLVAQEKLRFMVIGILTIE